LFEGEAEDVTLSGEGVSKGGVGVWEVTELTESARRGDRVGP